MQDLITNEGEEQSPEIPAKSIDIENADGSYENIKSPDVKSIGNEENDFGADEINILYDNEKDEPEIQN